MNADALDLPLLADRNDDEVERNAAMDSRFTLGFRHERYAAASLEVAHGAEAPALVRRCSRNAEDAERMRGLLVRSLLVITEKRHRSFGEPIEQRSALGIF